MPLKPLGVKVVLVCPGSQQSASHHHTPHFFVYPIASQPVLRPQGEDSMAQSRSELCGLATLGQVVLPPCDSTSHPVEIPEGRTFLRCVYRAPTTRVPTRLRLGFVTVMGTAISFKGQVTPCDMQKFKESFFRVC